MYTVEVMEGNKPGRKISAQPDENLLRLLQRSGFSIPSPCGGKGSCGKCKVKIREGRSTETPMADDEKNRLSSEEIKAGYRLACRIKVHEDLVVEVPASDEKEACILSAGEKNIPLKPLLTKKRLILSKPSINDQKSDVERIEEALNLPGRIPPPLIGDIPDLLRRNDFEVTAVLFGEEIIGIEGGDTSAEKYGLAVDIGTTTMVGYLLDLSTGDQIGTCSVLNPQRVHGADVVTRIDYTVENKSGLNILSDLVRDEINGMLSYFADNFGIPSARVYHMTVVGNTTMMHIFARLPVRNIALAPFIPAVTRRLDLAASDLGININSNGKVTILPMISGYVGADTVGAILACDMAEDAEVSLMIDIGTNGEIALGNKERILTCSTAAGPAFEGAHIRYGMGGVSGAVNTFSLGPALNFTTIGNKQAKGICGSGIIDITAELFRNSLIDETGRIKSQDELREEGVPESLAARIREVDGKPAFLVLGKDEGAAFDLYFDQKDIREVQLAKAAVAAGIQILLKESGITMDEISRVYLAGGFGNYINYENATRIGLIPKELKEKIVPIGNGAGTGSKMALLAGETLEAAEKIKEITGYIELSTSLDFQTFFVDLMGF